MSPENRKRGGPSRVADGLGYLCVDDDEISVPSLTWVSADKMKGYFILFPQQGRWRPPEAGWLAALLEQEGITHGIQEAAVERLSQQAVDSTRANAFLLAEATQGEQSFAHTIDL